MKIVIIPLTSKRRPYTTFNEAKSRHRLQLGHHRFQFYDKCKQIQVDLSRIKKVELFEKNKLLFTNLFLKIS